MSRFRKIVCHKLSANFREATEISSGHSLNELKKNLQPNEVVVKNLFLGINASDINFTNGIYLPGVQPPFDCGFEAVGEVVHVGKDVTNRQIGDPVALSNTVKVKGSVYVDLKSLSFPPIILSFQMTVYGAFSEYQAVPVKQTLPIPFLSPSILPLMVCGLTASIALNRIGQMTSNQTVLVTAAAGATGSFAVQLAKLAGNHVIGTCSSDDKCDYLKSLGCDRPINYKKEDLYQVLKSEYPTGVNLVFEGVGGSIYKACVNNLAVEGRLIVVGFVSGYQDSSGWKSSETSKGKPLEAKLLKKSASVRGFFLNNMPGKVKKEHMLKLTQLIQDRKLKPGIDPTSFKQLEGVADAIEYLYAGKNKGKLIVNLTQSFESRL